MHILSYTKGQNVSVCVCVCIITQKKGKSKHTLHIQDAAMATEDQPTTLGTITTSDQSPGHISLH